jgi:L-ascorbate metabolism protein UlaG (beta-lactamase superfamily)
MQTRRALRYAIAFASLVGAAAALVGASFLLSPTWPAPAVGARPGDASPIVQAKGPAAPLAVTRIAHASVLLDFDGVHVLTDPWFTEKWHYHQGEPLGLRLQELPRLDLIVASHAHYDHFDVKSLAAYPHKDVPILVGPNMVEAARAVGFTDVTELKPWQTWSRGALKVTGAPARHGVPEVTFVIEAKGRTVYFGGDTLFIPELRALPDRFPKFDLALLSVNGLRVMGVPVVMNAEEAAELVGIMKARVAVPIHYAFQGSAFTDTFVLSRNGTPERFVAAAKRHAPLTEVRVLSPGQRLVIGGR